VRSIKRAQSPHRDQGCDDETVDGPNSEDLRVVDGAIGAPKAGPRDPRQGGVRDASWPLDGSAPDDGGSSARDAEQSVDDGGEGPVCWDSDCPVEQYGVFYWKFLDATTEETSGIGDCTRYSHVPETYTDTGEDGGGLPDAAVHKPWPAASPGCTEPTTFVVP
jgi:hypothetical protein